MLEAQNVSKRTFLNGSKKSKSKHKFKADAIFAFANAIAHATEFKNVDEGHDNDKKPAAAGKNLLHSNFQIGLFANGI